MTFLLIAGVSMGLGWAAYQAAAPPEVPLSRYVPSGALLCLQAKDFSALLSDWNQSPQKQAWLASSNYEVFSRSRLLLRLKDAGKQFATAAGLPPDMNFLSQVAGRESALALYDIGKLQFVYITRLPSANAMQTQLWQTRSKFETRSAGGATFYLRHDPESQREVEFAVSGNYLLLATREDLMAGALQLIAGGKDRAIEAEPWFAQSVSAAGPVGDLRMVLNLEKIVPSPYFRSYWVQQNITDMKSYAAAISDLFRSGSEYREERVLLKKAGASASAGGEGEEVSDLVRLVPDSAGFYEAQPCPSTDPCLDVLETKILAPHTGPVPAGQIAPGAQLTSGETGSSSDLETRIDQAPAQHGPDDQGSVALKNLLQKSQVNAVLHVQSTERDKTGVFVRIHSAVTLAGAADWDEAAARNALTSFIRPSLTASQLGVAWKQANGYYELDGLHPLIATVRGGYLILADDPSLMSNMLANANRRSDVKPAVFVAEFNHQRERENFARLTTVVDRPDLSPTGVGSTQRQPQFLSENIASLSAALTAVSSERIVVHDTGDKLLQTVTYQWSQ
ncbi:MAG: hypothetical protein LAO18_21995 [Acidobacteriia bacterium]|nr:hypothetical protein [Terriglobia bacterium]